MEAINIKILNPKVKKLLEDLVELKLITMESKPSFKEILAKLRKFDEQALSMEDITKEVEDVRSLRYEKKA